VIRLQLLFSVRDHQGLPRSTYVYLDCICYFIFIDRSLWLLENFDIEISDFRKIRSWDVSALDSIDGLFLSFNFLLIRDVTFLFHRALVQ